MIQEQISKPQYTREQYLEFFSKAKNLDLSKQRNRKFLIDTFVNAVVLYDDKLLFYLNYKKNSFSVKVEDIESLSDSLLCAPPR
jgi:hypothetical protein